jgi:multiple antibiotic resistance protein
MFCILFGFLVAGTWIIEFFGISVPAIRIAGGLIIGFIGFRMLFPQEVTSEAREKAVTKKDIAFTPLAMPSLAGPGSIAVVLTVSGDNTQAVAYLFIGIGILTMAIICYCVLRTASWVKDRFGAYGIDAITGIMGFLLIAIAMQFIHLGVSVWIRETLKTLS